MAKSIKGTQTEKNLLTSFAGESQARMRYTYFASVAKKESPMHSKNCTEYPPVNIRNAVKKKKRRRKMNKKRGDRRG